VWYRSLRERARILKLRKRAKSHYLLIEGEMAFASPQPQYAQNYLYRSEVWKVDESDFLWAKQMKYDCLSREVGMALSFQWEPK
jgi:hypothetical protein